MRYLPYFLICLLLILAVFAVLLWLKPDPDPKAPIVAIEHEMSEESLKVKGMAPELLQELKDESVDLRILKLLVEELEALLPDAKTRLEALQVEKDRIVQELKSEALGPWTEPRIWKWFVDSMPPDFKAEMEALPQVTKDRLVQELKSEIGPWIINPRILKLLLDRIEMDRISDSEEDWGAYKLLSSEEWKTARQWREARSSYEGLKKEIKKFLTEKKTVKWRYDYHKRKLDQALDCRAMNPSTIAELSTTKLKEIYVSFRRKQSYYQKKFPRNSVTPDLADASIFSYEGDGKILISIPREQMTSEQREHLKLIKKHIEFARKGHFETKIIVQSDKEAVLITYYDTLPRTVKGATVLGDSSSSARPASELEVCLKTQTESYNSAVLMTKIMNSKHGG